MQLFHVSKRNKNKIEVDMAEFPKGDMQFLSFLIDVVNDYDAFYQTYNSEFMKMCSKKKKWTIEKMASEAIFEFVRRKHYLSSPSRLLYAYFTDSIEKAKKFNEKEREKEGDYFVFDADEDIVYYYDMDMFDSAVKILEKQGVTQQSFERIKEVARKYWLTSKEGNTEILYKGTPILKNIAKVIENDSIFVYPSYIEGHALDF